MDSQLDFLPGLGCLNYLSSIGPIVDSLPNSLRFKWEKRVVQYAEKHGDAYPNFKDFATMVCEQAKLKNHPNVLASAVSTKEKQRTQSHRTRQQSTSMTNMEPERRVLKSKVENKNAPRKDNGEENYCNFHQRRGHRLKDCKAFENESLDSKTTLSEQRGCAFVASNLATDPVNVLKS